MDSHTQNNEATDKIDLNKYEKDSDDSIYLIDIDDSPSELYCNIRGSAEVTDENDLNECEKDSDDSINLIDIDDSPSELCCNIRGSAEVTDENDLNKYEKDSDDSINLIDIDDSPSEICCNIRGSAEHSDWTYDELLQSFSEDSKCPKIDCYKSLPIYKLAEHIETAHAEYVRYCDEWESKFTMDDLYKYRKIAHVQIVCDRMFLTTMEFIYGSLLVTLRYIPDGWREDSSAIVHFKKQEEVRTTWTGPVLSYKEVKLDNFFTTENLESYDKSEKFSIETKFFIRELKE